MLSESGADFMAYQTKQLITNKQIHNIRPYVELSSGVINHERENTTLHRLKGREQLRERV